MSPRARRLLVAFFVVTAVVCARLGFWQVGRLRERRAANAAALAARSLPPVVLGRAAAPDSALVNRRAVATGRYDHTYDLVVRGQAYEGVPGVHVVTPLLLDGGDTAVLVLRGFVPSPDATTAAAVDSLREPGEVRVEGIVLAVPSGPGGGQPLSRDGRTTWRQLDLAAIRDSLPYPVLGVYIRQTPDRALPPFPRRLPPPSLDDGPHLSYAIQWFSFTALALVFAGVMLIRRGGPTRAAPAPAG